VLRGYVVIRLNLNAAMKRGTVVFGP